MSGGLVSVTAIFGVPLDLRVGRPLARPWEVVADVAVQVHSVGPGSELGGHSTCRQHAIPESEVRFYELCFAVRWYRESLGPQGAHPPEEYLRRLRSVLRLAEKSSRAL